MLKTLALRFLGLERDRKQWSKKRDSRGQSILHRLLRITADTEHQNSAEPGTQKP